MKIFSGSSNKPLAEKIAHAMGTHLSPIEIFVFPDGERRIQIQERVVDEDTVAVQSTSTPTAENFMELFFIVDGLKRSGAKSITAVVPYFGYQRQDHIFRDGEAVSLDVVVHALEGAGATKVICVDFHSIKIPEVFKVPVAHLSALPLFAERIKELSSVISNDSERSHGDFSASPRNDKGGFLASPDMGGLRRINKMSELLDGMPWIATVKDRDLDTGNIVIEKIDPSAGSGPEGIKGKNKAFIVDDMIASGKTIVESAKLLHEQGASDIFVFATHPVFSREAPELLQNSLVRKVFVTDTVDVPEEKRFEKLEILSVSEMIASSLRDQA